MSYLAIFQRVVPFLLTFVAGLLIASVFIPISAPNFKMNEGGGRRCRDHKRQMYFENENLRMERDRLRDEIEQLRRDVEEVESRNLLYKVPEGTVKTFRSTPPPPPAKR